jgi:hypothetical protein
MPADAGIQGEGELVAPAGIPVRLRRLGGIADHDKMMSWRSRALTSAHDTACHRCNRCD